MAYNIKDLNVSSLDYTDIVESLTSFLEKQPTLTNIDFRNTSSAANMLINILATATAYNGVYSYFGYNESFKTSAQNIESFAGLASNESVLLTFAQSATSQITINASSAVDAYTPFVAKATDGTNILFFNKDDISVGTNSYTLYSGTQAVTYTNYDYDKQYCTLPINVDPRTIRFVLTDVINGTQKEYTKVERGEEPAASGSYFTVINGADGYIVTNNFVNSAAIDLNKKVEIFAVITNGDQGNSAQINPLSSTTFITQSTPSGGYSTLSVERARSLLLFNGNGRKRWVTLNDLKYAIMSSGISGTDDLDLITVANDNTPASVKVYVDGLSSSSQTDLLNYLQGTGPAGIDVIYSL
jgi:hypothetical protein